MFVAELPVCRLSSAAAPAHEIVAQASKPKVIRSRLEAALEYFRRGLMPVSIDAGTKKPTLENWPDLRLTNEDLFKYFSGNGNIGINLGMSGDVVDVDMDVPEAIQLAPKFLTPTAARTGRPRARLSHWWYHCPGAIHQTFKDPITDEMIIEFRAGRHQTLVGPSIHPDTGESYDMLEGEMTRIGADELLSQVIAIYEAVLIGRYGHIPAKPEPKYANVQNVMLSEAGTSVPLRVRLKRARAYLAKIPQGISGQGGHNRTFHAARVVVFGFDLDRESALKLLMEEYNPRCEPPWSEKELRHKVDDADKKPFGQPRGWLLEASLSNSGHRAIVPVSSSASVYPPLSSTGHIPLTDLGNAERLIAQFGDDLRYCHENERWYTWDGCRWGTDNAGTVNHFAAQTVRAMLKEASETDDPRLRDALAKWALTSQSCYRLESMVSVARSIPAIVVRIADLDADPWRLNVKNGTIDLKTGRLLPARREDLITQLAPVAYYPSATCPKFDAFMCEVMGGDLELIEFTQRWFGYCLTGDVSEQCMPICHGPGANGKSVLMDTLMGLMGGYAGLAPPHLLVESKSQEHPTEIADMKGKRLVVASETEENGALKLQLVKRLTGDAKLKGRFMRQDYFEFARTHKLMLVTNNTPRVRENSEAAWRRLLLVPFKMVIPEERRDPKLLTALVEERPGILRWLVEGCLAWQREGLKPPWTVRLATEGYRLGEDDLGKYFSERCVVEEGGVTPWKTVWESYCDWADAAGVARVSQGTLREFLERRGHRSKNVRVDGGVANHRIGLRMRLNSDDDPP